MEFSFHTSSSYWARKGDRMSREFFQTHAQRTIQDQVRNLRTVAGCLCTNQEEVMEIAIEFYRSLFQQEQLVPRTRRCCEEVWRHIPSIVYPRMGKDLLAPFTAAAMQDVVMAINGQKCLGGRGGMGFPEPSSPPFGTRYISLSSQPSSRFAISVRC